MVRPKKECRIRFCPKWNFFKPDGVAKSDMETILLSPEEVEALRLRNLKELDQTQAAKEMNISQSTYQRIITGANKKVTEAIIKGKAIKIIQKQVSN